MSASLIIPTPVGTNPKPTRLDTKNITAELNAHMRKPTMPCVTARMGPEYMLVKNTNNIISSKAGES